MSKGNPGGKDIRKYMLRSYLVLACISICIELILCGFMLYRAKASVTRTQTAELEKICLQMDNVLSHLNEQSNQLCNDSLTEKILSYSGKPAYFGTEVLAVQELMSVFQDKINFYEEIANIYLVDAGFDSVIDRSNIFHDNLCLSVLEQMGLNEQSFAGVSATEGGLPVVVKTGTDDVRMFCIQGVFKTSYNKADGYIIIEVNIDYLMEKLDFFSGIDGKRAYIFNTDVGYIGPDLQEWKLIEKILAQNKISSTVYDGSNRYIYSICFSGEQSLGYCYVMTTAAYYKEVYWIAGVIAVHMIILLVAAIVLSWRFTKKNTEPLVQISDVLKMPEEDNDFSYDYILKKVSTLTDKVEKYEKRHNKNLLSQIFWGQEKNEKTIMDYQKKNCKDTGKFFYVLGIKVQDINELSDANVLVFCVINVFGELLAENLLLHPVEGWDRAYFMIKGEESAIRAAINYGITYMEEKLSIGIACGISEKKALFAEIREGKSQADYMIEFIEFTPELRRQLWYDETFSDITANNSVFRADLNKLIHSVVTQDYKSAKIYLEKIWKENIYIPGMEPDRARTRMITIGSIISIQYRKRYGEKDFGKPQQHLVEMYEFIVKLLEKLQNDKESEHTGSQTFEQIFEYIRAHATNPAITAGSVCEVFHLTPSYVSGMFKKYLGEGVLDTIHKERIRQAKSLLKEGVSVQETALAVGYLDARGFIRTFKKYEGITPGQYKTI